MSVLVVQEKLKENIFETTKDIKKMHGIGLSSVKRLLKNMMGIVNLIWKVKCLLLKF